MKKRFTSIVLIAISSLSVSSDVRAVEVHEPRYEVIEEKQEILNQRSIFLNTLEYKTPGNVYKISDELFKEHKSFNFSNWESLSKIENEGLKIMLKSGLYNLTYLTMAKDGKYQVTFSNMKTENEERLKFVETEVKKMTEEILRIYNPKTTYQVLSSVDSYISSNFKYNINPSSGGSAWSLNDFIVGKEGVCQAYAMLASELLDSFGIENDIQIGMIQNYPQYLMVDGVTPLHAWNSVKIDGEWYNYDPTWNATGYTKRYLAVTNEFFGYEGMPRDFYSGFYASQKSPNLNESYDYSEFQLKKANKKEENYKKYFWALNEFNDNKILFEMMDFNPNKTYKLEIKEDASVHINIDGESLKVNSIFNFTKEDFYKLNNGKQFEVEVNSEKFEINFKEPVFSDINDSFAFTHIIDLYNRNIIKGTQKDIFSPKGNMTRGQVVGILGRYYGFEDKASFEIENFGKHWASSHYQELKKMKVTENLENFYAHETISKIETIHLMFNVLEKEGFAPIKEGQGFVDKYKFSSNFDYQRSTKMRSIGIIDGNENNEFNPNQKLTREQFAKILNNTIEYIETNKEEN